jgi:hypothetical protein
MTLKTTIVVVLIFVMTASYLLEENNRHDQNAEKSETTAVNSDNSKVKDAACYDAKMEKWFIAFNDYQQQGLKMGEADKKAYADADRLYNNCLSNTEIATNTPPAAADNK